jgi:hypothetical protein
LFSLSSIRQPKQEIGIMSANKTYKCQQCGREVEETPPDREHSDCCQARWVESDPLPVCTQPGSSEHTRFDADDEPCDDGRGG